MSGDADGRGRATRRAYPKCVPAEGSRDAGVDFLGSHATASALTAVKNGDVYRGGGLYQGPIANTVLAEGTARQLYDFDGEPFDRQRVADVVNGEL